jgi:hypothetical protein
MILNMPVTRSRDDRFARCVVNVAFFVAGTS